MMVLFKGIYIIKISHLFHKKKVKTYKKPCNELYLDMSAFIFVPSFYWLEQQKPFVGRFPYVLPIYIPKTFP